MATASRGSLQLDLGDLERALNKAQRITDQGMRNMQLRVEEAGRKIAAALANSQASALDTTASAFDDLRKAYDPAARAADDFSKSQSSLNALLQQNKSAGTEYAQTLEASGKKLRAYSTELESLRTSGALAASQLGRGRRQQDLATQLSANDEKYALAREALDKQYPQGATQAPATYTDTAGIRFPAGDAYGRGAERADDYAIKLDELKTKHSDMTLQIQSNYVQMSESLGDWRNGASSALDDYMNKAGDVAAQSKAVFTSAFEQMDAAILQFATTGKFSFSDFAKSVLKDMAMLAAKTAASKALSSLFGMASSAVMGLFGSTATPAPTTTSVGSASYTFDPQLSLGSSFKYANGGVFTNGVATGPTLAPMALFGEAGPEAIMPLSRGADGSLGVVALGGGQSGTTSNQQVLIQQTINVPDGQAGASGAGMNSQSLANAYASAAKQGAAEQIARDLKPGGQIWSVINGR
ncbi:phage tail tape measure protein [Pseudomonas protegens]|uniref:phage tail tape measure protein n=1 Tax=Pseudomonas protegens TaxID=380021 RepID=UPI00069F4B14|nr:phage tail tape measure protein [Pseudomonas protegens]